MTPSPTIPSQESALPELANCPFCGSVDGPGIWMAHRVVCGGCDAEGPSLHDALSANVAAWNRRATPPIQQGVVEAWQPIETAPKGTRAPLLGVVGDGIRLIRWGKTSHVPLYGWCLADQGVEDFDLCRPTHWMPLPAPPSLRATSGENGK